METLYQVGTTKILELIERYIALLDESSRLGEVHERHFEDELWRAFLLCGRGIEFDELPHTASEARAEYQARSGIPHDLQSAISGPLYDAMRCHAFALVRRAKVASGEFRNVKPEVILNEPELIPVFMHCAGGFSKAVLQQKGLGSLSDQGVGRRVATRFAEFVNDRLDPEVDEARVVERMGSTVEGQVRDLLGRHLLEALVESALKRRGVPFKREQEYESLAGVVYDHRADFVVPDSQDPHVFVEVRRSSARHSSLYAKDKMFSAINWKGRYPDLVGVLIADGEWSRESLLALAKVFDYVLQVNEADELSNIAADYLAGDSSRLRRVITFSIENR